MAKTKRLKKIAAGQVVDVYLYTPPTRWDTPKQRAAKSRVTSAAQAAYNRKDRRKRLEYLIACNYSGKDRFITLTYDDAHLPANRAEARQDVKAFLATVRKLRRKAGQPFKYIYVTEDLGGQGRFHHHLILTAADGDIEQLQSLWGRGNVDVKSLSEYGPDFFTNRAEYMNKERKPKGEKGFVCSQNMTLPTITSEWVDENITITSPYGATVLEDTRDSLPMTGAEYRHLKYILPPADGQQYRPDKRGRGPLSDLE